MKTLILTSRKDWEKREIWSKFVKKLAKKGEIFFGIVEKCSCCKTFPIQARIEQAEKEGVKRVIGVTNSTSLRKTLKRFGIACFSLKDLQNLEKLGI